MVEMRKMVEIVIITIVVDVAGEKKTLRMWGRRVLIEFVDILIELEAKLSISNLVLNLSKIFL